MKLALVLLLAVRTYYPVSISDLAAGRNSHTHIRVTGKVLLVKHEADGDLHIRLSDGKRFIVAECIPKLPCVEPKVGQTITVEGIYRRDAKHGGWAEVHPVESLSQEITLERGGNARFGPFLKAAEPKRDDLPEFTRPTCRELPCDEPAIQVVAPENGEPLVLRDPNDCADGWMVNSFYGNHCASRKYWTCADKTRILMHDEEQPPKYWCYAPHP